MNYSCHHIITTSFSGNVPCKSCDHIPKIYWNVFCETCFSISSVILLYMSCVSGKMHYDPLAINHRNTTVHTLGFEMSKCRIVGYLSGALWDLWDGSLLCLRVSRQWDRKRDMCIRYLFRCNILDSIIYFNCDSWTLSLFLVISISVLLILFPYPWCC